MNGKIEFDDAESRPANPSLIKSESSSRSIIESDGYTRRGSIEFDETEAGFLDYLNLARRHALTVFTTIAAFLALGVGWTLLATKRYTAIELLQIDRNVAKIVEGANNVPVDSTDTEFMKTQYEILQSRSIAQRVVSKLRLADEARFGGGTASLLRFFRPDTANRTEQADRERRAIDIILSERVVKPVFGSRLVEIRYTDPDPVRAQLIAQELADAFIAANLDKRFEANAYAKAFLDDQLKQLQIKLQESEKAQIEYGEKEKIIATEEKSSIAENNLAQANASVGKLIADRMKAEQIFRQTEHSDPLSIAEVLQSQVILELRSMRTKLMAEYQEKLPLYKPDFPEMRQIAARLREVDNRIKAEAKKIVSSLKASYEMSLAQEEEMKVRVEQLKSEVLDLQKRSIVFNGLKREANVNRTLYENLLQKAKELGVASGAGANNVFVVDKAEIPREPSSPKLILNLLIALFLGTIAGIGAAFIIEWLDDRLHSVEDLEKISGLPTLGIIPKYTGSESPEKELDIITSPIAEAYRSLCTSLYFSSANGLPKTLALTSTAPSEGKTISCVAIGRHFAQSGMKVLLIDADLRKGTMHNKLGLQNVTGLSNYLVGAGSPQNVLQHTPFPNLSFMASGPLPPNAAELLASSRMASLLTAANQAFDIVIIDGAPVMDLADALLLSNLASATIFVAAAEQTRKPALRAALRRLRFSRGRLIGTLLVKHDLSSTGYGYGYGYGYGDEGNEANGKLEKSRHKPSIPEVGT